MRKDLWDYGWVQLGGLDRMEKGRALQASLLDCGDVLRVRMEEEVVVVVVVANFSVVWAEGRLVD